jgi:hypothetical protein
MTEAEVRAELQAETDRVGMRQWARSQHPPISVGYVNDVLKGRKLPGPKILAALGLRHNYLPEGASDGAGQ